MANDKQEVFLTKEGQERLEEELEHFRTVRRREVAERIKIAISFGDISENSEYEDAKNEQAFIEGHILDLDNKLRNAKLIEDEAGNAENVSVGSTVILEDLETGDKTEYTIVGSMEADPLHNKISNESPVGAAILGTAMGETVNVNAPGGVMQYKVLNINK